jgi:hypothetical protein
MTPEKRTSPAKIAELVLYSLLVRFDYWLMKPKSTPEYTTSPASCTPASE